MVVASLLRDAISIAMATLKVNVWMNNMCG